MPGRAGRAEYYLDGEFTMESRQPSLSEIADIQKLTSSGSEGSLKSPAEISSALANMASFRLMKTTCQRTSLTSL